MVADTIGQNGFVLDVLVQSRRDFKAARRLRRKLLKQHRRAPHVLITGKLNSYGTAPGASRDSAVSTASTKG